MKSSTSSNSRPFFFSRGFITGALVITIAGVIGWLLLLNWSIRNLCPHAPFIKTGNLADYEAIYSNQSTDSEESGKRGLGLYNHIFFGTREINSDFVDSAKITLTGQTLKIEAVKKNEIVAVDGLRQNEDFVLTSQGLKIKDEREHGQTRNHNIPYYFWEHSKKFLRLCDDGSLVVEERYSVFTLTYYVIPTRVTGVTETVYRRISKLPTP